MSRLGRDSTVGRVLAIGLVAGLAITAGCRRATTELASERERVLDLTEALSEGQRGSIADYLAFIDSERGIDYRVVVIDEPRADLEAAAVATYERLGVGAGTEGRGLLLLVNVAAEEARVEVGYSLEPRVRDVEASSMIRDFLAPYFSSGQVAMGIEASVERLVDIVEPSLAEGLESGPSLVGSGGGGATGKLLQGIDRLTPESRAKLDTILVPQANPENCIHLEMELMTRGIYYRDAPMYDDAWRRAVRPDLPAERLQTIARDWVGPFQLARVGDHAITYFTGEKGQRFGPHFLRRTVDGWIVDASPVAEFIVYDYSNRFWVALEGDYPYLPIIRSVYDMRRVSSPRRGAGWMVELQ